MENKLNIAYFRHNPKTGQCELRFNLDVTHEKCGRINQEIRAARQSRDNINSLLKHIQNKIINIVGKKDENEETKKEILDTDIDVSLWRSGMNVKGDLPCIEIINICNRLRFTIFKTSYKVVCNAPLVEVLTLPKIIYTSCYIKPARFKGMFLNSGLSEIIWSKSQDKSNWTEVGYEFHYFTKLEDIDSYLKFACIPVSKYGTRGPAVEVVSENVIYLLPAAASAPLDIRHSFTKDKLSGKNIRVISYNVLAERYTEDDQFSYCDPRFLAMDYRKQMLTKEILGYNADLVCLQEVDFSIYKNYFKKTFGHEGYASVFNKKGDIIPEGLTLLYNKSRFKKVNSKHFVLANELKRNGLFQQMWGLVKHNDEIKESFIKLHTSLHLTALKHNETNDVILIVNTHLYYHYEANHLRLIQITMAVKFIEKWCKMLKASENCRVLVIFCGDFNSKPNSGVYKFMTEGHVENCKEELGKLRWKQAPKMFSHNFNFISAYGTPEFTNYTEDFKGCLDYIFYPKNDFEVLQLVPLPSESDMSEAVALPNQRFPSDHVALIADLSFK